MSNSYSEKAHPSSIYTRFNTRYVIHLFCYTNTNSKAVPGMTFLTYSELASNGDWAAVSEHDTDALSK